MKGNSIKTVGSVFFIIMFAKILGQVREMLLAASYGTSYQANAYLTASQIPLNFFDMILGLAIVSAFVPVFNEFYQKGGKNSANSFAGNFLGVILLISVLLSLFGVIFSAFIVSKIATGLDAKTALLASKLLKILFPSVIFTSVAYAYAGILQSYGEFKIPAAMSVISNAVTIIYFIFFNDKFGIFGLSVSMLIGWILQLVVLVPPLVKLKFSFRISFNFFSEGMKKVYLLACPILISSWVQPINVMFNLYLASFLNNGDAVSAINYANKLYLIIASVFTVSVTNITLPSLSREFSSGNGKEASDIITGSVKAVVLFLIPVLVLFVIYRTDIIQIIYQRGEFDENSTFLTSTALGFYSIGMLGYGLQEVMNKAFYAMQKPKVTAVVAVCTVVINIVLSFTLYKILGIGGLALSSAIASTFGGFVLIVIMSRKLENIDLGGILITFFKSLGAALIACAVSFVVIKIIPLGNKNVLIHLAKLCLSGGIAVVLYVTLLFVLRVKELSYITNMLKKSGD